MHVCKYTYTCACACIAYTRNKFSRATVAVKTVTFKRMSSRTTKLGPRSVNYQQPLEGPDIRLWYFPGVGSPL